MAEKLDARIEKTLDKLRKALIEMMKDESIDSITVTALCRRAGINRNTFYAHFDEPAQLLQNIEDLLLGMMWQTLSQVDTDKLDLKDFVTGILTVIDSNRQLCQVILSPHGRSRNFIARIVGMIQDKTMTLWISKGMTREEADITYHYCVSGALGVIENWVNSGFVTDVGHLANMLSDLIEDGQIRNINRYY